MADLGVTGLLELPPAGTLAGIAKRNLKGVELFTLNTPDQLPEANDFVAKHGDSANASPLSSTPSWMLVVSPGKGEFRLAQGVEAGSDIAAGTPLGTVANLRDSVVVNMAHAGTITEWLVEDGDPVSPGQPLVRLYPSHDSAGVAP